MKSPSYWRAIEPTFLVIPPELSTRIRAEYRTRGRSGLISQRAVRPILHRYNYEPDFCERVHAFARDLHRIIFSDDPGWGVWPTDLQEIVAVGLLLGLSLEGAIDDTLLGLTEEEMVCVEKQCKEESLSINELMIDRLFESKQEPGESWKGGEA